LKRYTHSDRNTSFKVVVTTMKGYKRLKVILSGQLHYYHLLVGPTNCS